VSEPTKAVFLSYASQDAEAAKRIADALRAAGVEAWFDQSELRGGDAWDGLIRKRIKECALFVPVITPNTNARAEGYFRLEWKLAVDRSHLLADDHPFLFPIVIGDVTDATARVPDKFRDVQWTRLRLDETPSELGARVARLLSTGSIEAGRPRSAERGEGTTPPKKGNPSWLRYGWAAVGIIFALVYAVRPLFQEAHRPAPAPPPPKVSVTAVQSEARKLVAQARQVYEGGDELNRENLFFAEDLVKRALTLDPSDPEAWELSASLSYTMVWHLIDNSEQRRTTLMSQSARALALAPQSVPAQLVVINARLAMNFNSLAVGAADLEQELLALAAREPQNWQVQSALGSTYRFLNRPEESIRALQRAVELSGGHSRAVADLVNVLLRRKRYAEADAAIAAALPGHPTGRLLTFDAITKLRWRGDAAAARQSLEAWPAWLLQEDRGIFVAWQTWMWSREPQRALRAAQGSQRDYVRDANFYGPRAVLTAQAHELAGNTEAARADWQTVLTRVERELAAEPENDAALYWKAWALARLGQTAEAQPIALRLQQRNQSSLSVFFKGTYLAPLLVTVGQPEAALAEIKTRFGVFDDSLGITRARLELDPAFDPLRTDLRFRELLESAPAPKDTAASAAKVDGKSVAVLAFANLSDDKANEYFSDGISEELLNVLAKIPNLKVSARTSAFYFKGKEVPVPEIARQLGVAYVIEGSVRKQGAKVRITAQLIKAADGFHVWSDTFTRDLKDIFAVQDEIAGLIAQNLQLTLRTNPRARTVNPEAYELMLKGRAFFNRGAPAEYPQGIQSLKDSLSVDPGSAAAWGRLSMGYMLAFAQNVPDWLPRDEILRLGRQAADRAVELDPEQPLGHYARSLIAYLADWDWARADASMQRVLELTPGDAESLGLAASLALTAGQTSRARETALRGVALDPLNFLSIYQLLKAYWESADYEKLDEEARRLIAIHPGSPYGHTFLSYSLVLRGRAAEARVAAERIPSASYRLCSLALANHALGKTAEAETALGELKKQFGRTSAYQVAENYAFRKDRDQAFEWLEAAYRERDAGLTLITNDPFMANLRTDARWGAFMRKLNLPTGEAK